MRRLGALVAALLALTLLTSCSAPAPAGRTFAGSRIDGLYRLPAATLVGTDGAPATLRPTRAVTVLFFGYANCPDVCTGIVTDLAQARARLSPPQRDAVEIVVVTTDPARDTPQAWGAYLDRIDPAITGLTGPLDDIVALGRAVGVDITRGRELPTGGYEVDHGTQVLVFGRDGQSLLVWTTGKSIADLRADLELLVKEQS